MKIKISWHNVDAMQSASSLAGPIGAEVHVALLPLPVVNNYWTKGLEGLTFEATGLNQRISVPRGQWDQSQTVSTTISLIEAELRTRGVKDANVWIDDAHILAYAAKQEERAENYKREILSAVGMLRNTRNWFGSKIFRDIRLFLERAIAEPTRN